MGNSLTLKSSNPNQKKQGIGILYLSVKSVVTNSEDWDSVSLFFLTTDNTDTIRIKALEFWVRNLVFIYEICSSIARGKPAIVTPAGHTVPDAPSTRARASCGPICIL